MELHRRKKGSPQKQEQIGNGCANADAEDAHATTPTSTPTPQKIIRLTIKKHEDDYYAYKQKILFYARAMTAEIMTIRYNNEMFHYYNEFLEKNKNKLGCAYGLVKPITDKIREGRKIYVLEMNNDENKIVGIGRIAMTSVGKARIYHEKYHIYPKMSMLEKYNRYLYFGRKRISRESMDEVQEKAMKILDKFCFRGSGNLKRGNGGITHFPFHILYECSKFMDLAQFIDDMFMDL